MHTLETFHDAETGVTLKITIAADLSNPYDDDDAVRIAILHRNYINPAKAAGLDSVEAIAEFEAANPDGAGEWEVFPLFLYDHSGTVYRPSLGGNPFSCPWDSGRVGVLALKRSEWATGDEDRATLFARAVGVAEDYTAWANGHGYDYDVTDRDGDDLDSSNGYLGDYEGETSEAWASYQREIAKARTAIARELEASRPDLAPA